MTGLILFAHGARDPRWAAPFQAVAERVRALRPDAAVRLAFLELMTPGLQAAVDELIAAGCRRIDVLPMFLGTGGHVRNDLPLLVQGLRAKHAEVRITLHAPIGEAPSVIDAMANVASRAASLALE